MKGRAFLAALASQALVLSTAMAQAPGLTQQQKDWLEKAERHTKNGWAYLHVEGEPRARGFQHGYLMAKEIEEALRGARITWEYRTALKWSWLVGKVATLVTPKIGLESLAELDGIVEGLNAAGVASSEQEIVAYNDFYELIHSWWPEELKNVKDGPPLPPKESCSAFIATGSMTADGGIVLGHNTHKDYTLPLPYVVADIRPRGAIGS